MKVTIFHTLDQAWESVGEKGISYVFQTYEWISCWLETVGEERGFVPHVVLVSDEKGTPFMLIPLGLETRYGMKRLVFPDAIVTDYSAPILFPNLTDPLNPADFKRIWKKILAALPPVDLINFKHMPDRILGRPNPFMQLTGLSDCSISFSSRLDGDWETYLQMKKGSKSRNTIRRKLKKLNEIGKLSFEVVTDVSKVDAVIDQLIEQKIRRLVDTGATNFLKKPAYRAFYRQLAKRHLSDGLAHLSFLKLNDTILAAHLGVTHQGRFYYLVPSFEAGEWERYSPGQLLLIHLIDHCFDQGLAVIDFTIGDESYKMEWAEPDLTLYNYVQGVSAKGKLYAEIRRIVLRLKREFKQLFPVLYYALKRKLI